MKIYTKTGDKGSTSLIGGERVKKDDKRVCAYGSVDELMAFVAHLHDKLLPYPEQELSRASLKMILRKLMDVAEVLALGESSTYCPREITKSEIMELEQSIDEINSTLTPISDFTLGCGHEILSFTHICRTVARRAEREIVALEGDYSMVQTYVNRLSDYLYILGRKFTSDFNVKETLRNE
ncbi:MAG: cob(I)yrinic acid a,c-diamide adenosyltransferase [Rikenellaceae bacterium]